MEDIVNTWEYENYKVILHDPKYDFKQEKYGISYKFYVKDVLLFSGDDFYLSPLYAMDSEMGILSLLNFLTLQPGDTDEEYFQNYTQEQLDWSDSFECESLGCYLLDREEEIRG